MNFLKILRTIPRYIIKNNLILVIIKFAKFFLDIIGISLFFVIIFNLINNQTTKLDLTFYKLDFSFLNNLLISEVIFITAFVFFIKFFITLILNFLELFIYNKNLIFTQKIGLKNFYFKDYLEQKNKDVSKTYRNLTSEIKFTTVYILNLVNFLTNLLILIAAIILIFLISGINAVFVVIIIFTSLIFFYILFKDKLNKYGETRILYNRKFYQFFHETIKFLKETKIFNKSKSIINRLSHLKQKEWQVGYLSKFINASTPSIIEFLLIMFILLILFLNINIDLFKNAEFIVFIIILSRLLPYLKELQLNINQMSLNYPSYEVFSRNFHELKNKDEKKNIHQKLNNLDIETQVNEKNYSLNFSINKKFLIISEQKNLDKLSDRFIGIEADNTKIFFNGEELSDIKLSNKIGEIGFCNNSPIIFNANLFDNITLFSKKIDTSKLEKIKNLLGLSYIFEKYTDELLIDKNVEYEIRIKLGLARALYLGKDYFIFNNVINQNNFDKTTIDRIFDYLNEKFVIVLSNNEENFDNFSDFIKI